MAKVKFVNAAKYKGTLYPAHTSFDVDDKDVEQLVQKGAIVVVAPPQTEETPDDTQKAIHSMKVEQLKAYAAEHGIDIKGIDKKRDIVAAILAAESSEE